MKKINNKSIIALAIGFLLSLSSFIGAATSVNLETVDDFAVLAGSTITNTGSSVINGDLGLSPGTSVTGFPAGIVNGTQQIANSTALQAQNDLTTAYNNAAGQTSAFIIPTELGGTTKTAGVYSSTAGDFSITGTLTLDAQGDPNAVFIFKTASTLTTAGASRIVLINGAQACNVFWQVGSSATLGTNSTFKGNILAFTSITLTTGANVEGRILARNGAVTLDTNTITKTVCIAEPAPVSDPEPEPVSDPEPEPASDPEPTIEPEPVSDPEPTIEPEPTSDSDSEPISTSTPVVSTTVPGLPNTGVSNNTSNNILWNIITLIVIFFLSSLFYLIRKKQID